MTSWLSRRTHLVHGPTPLVRLPRLADRFGLDLWIKRDDASGGAEAGNKLRKLEFLVHHALAQRADTLVTGGSIRSNHARTTAIVAAALGLRCELCLWSDDAAAVLPASGNELFARMAGARIRRVGPIVPSVRESLLAETADAARRAGRTPYVIPEGGSDAIGALGYVAACREIRRQLDCGIAGGQPFDAIVVPCSTGGTTAGLVVGAAVFNVAPRVLAVPVEGDTATLRFAVGRIVEAVRRSDPAFDAVTSWDIDEGGERAPSQEKSSFVNEVARLGLITDPFYTGPALWGFANAIRDDGRWVGKRVLFIHTGGLMGVEPTAFADPDDGVKRMAPRDL